LIKKNKKIKEKKNEKETEKGGDWLIISFLAKHIGSF